MRCVDSAAISPELIELPGQRINSVQGGECMLAFASLPLAVGAETLQAMEVLAVAIGIAGIAILILFAKRKI
ncbi:MAG: hypothetical protein E6K95_09870 [Thaumarchaeota archaeon]|nr:MAG: hypothetical protein E6K95_09870 [Nitrososphaerota archaeon]